MSEENGFPDYPNPAKKLFGGTPLDVELERVPETFPTPPTQDERDNWDIDLPKPVPTIRTFESGATREQDTSKLDLEGFMDPLVFETFGRYMHFHRMQEDGSQRDSDNWQKGIPTREYVKSGLRHFIDIWKWYRGYTTREGILFACCGVLFNVHGIMRNLLNGVPDTMEHEVSVNTAARKERWRGTPTQTNDNLPQTGVVGFPGS